MKSVPAAIIPPVVAKPVEIPAGAAALQGELDLPAGMHGLVVFALASATLRHSPRHRRIAGALQHAGFGTLVLDLLTVAEARADADRGALPLDVPLLASRLELATRWVDGAMGERRQPVGLFAIETGAAAALLAATHESAAVRAIVAADGRPDLAREALTQVSAPTLLMAGAHDATLLEINSRAADAIPAEHHLEVFPEATSPLREPTALPHVIEASVAWFDWYLQADSR